MWHRRAFFFSKGPTSNGESRLGKADCRGQEHHQKGPCSCSLNSQPGWMEARLWRRLVRACVGPAVSSSSEQVLTRVGMDTAPEEIEETTVASLSDTLRAALGAPGLA